MYKKLKYNTIAKAKTEQKRFITNYGYKPKIFTENSKYIIIKPKGLKRVK